jgi:hypothetical protein
LEERSLLTVLPLTLADPSLNGITGIKESSRPSITADGQLIAFQSNADNLVPNDSNGVSDVFVYNRTAGTVTLVTVGPNGFAGGGSNPVISSDGRYIAFESNSRGILPSFINDGQTQVFLRDLRDGSTSLASIGTNGAGGNRASSQAAFSADSHQLGFLSNADNLVAGIRSGQLPTARPAEAKFYYDVSGDGFCVPVDALQIVNFLNGNLGEGEASAKVTFVKVTDESFFSFPLRFTPQQSPAVTDRSAPTSRRRSETTLSQQPALSPCPESATSTSPKLLKDWQETTLELDAPAEISDELAMDVLQALTSYACWPRNG